LEQELIHALVTCLAPEALMQTRLIGVRRTAVMSRLEDVLAAHTDRPLRVPGLCAETGVSERTLRLYCAESLGMSPARYLRLRHLKLARKSLLEVDSETASSRACRPARNKAIQSDSFSQMRKRAPCRAAIAVTADSDVRRPPTIM